MNKASHTDEKALVAEHIEASNEVLFMAWGIGESTKKNMWLIDNASFNHLTGDESQFTIWTELTGLE